MELYVIITNLFSFPDLYPTLPYFTLLRLQGTRSLYVHKELRI